MGSYHETCVLGWLKFGDLVSLNLFSVVVAEVNPRIVWTVDLLRCPTQLFEWLYC